MSVSDNTAADLLLARVGLDTVRLLTEELGLTGIRLVGGPRDVLESMLDEVGARTEGSSRPAGRHCRTNGRGGSPSWTPRAPTPVRPVRSPGCSGSSGATGQARRRPAPGSGN